MGRHQLVPTRLDPYRFSAWAHLGKAYPIVNRDAGPAFRRAVELAAQVPPTTPYGKSLLDEIR
ncbi:MAG: hypothetical protein AB1758_18665 [Candidatus Eremiobacterota bacterium]